MSNNEKKLFKKIYDIRREELYKKNNNLFKSWLKMEDYNNISNEQKIHYFIDNILNIVINITLNLIFELFIIAIV